MEAQNVISKTHKGKRYYMHLRVKGITSDLVISESQISSVLCFRKVLLCQNILSILTFFLCISLSYC